MTCFNSHSSSGFSDSCCSGNNLCQFNGNLDDVVSVPVYVQSIYDAVQFNLQGMKTIQNQTFTPCIPCGLSVSRIADIRTKAYFNPCNTSDPSNLTVNMDTTLSGATFLQDCSGEPVTVIGPDGFSSQKILYPDESCCDDACMGTPVFGTQNVMITGNIIVYVDLILCDSCNRESKCTVSAEVPIATASRPMCLTNFFEICIPASTEHAFLPRFTELSSISSNARLATNNCGRDITINPNGELCANLIISICVNAEKTVVAPVQMCVLSTGMVDVPAQTSTSGCNGFPSMFAGSIAESDASSCCNSSDCGCGPVHNHDSDCGCGCEPLFDRDNDCGCKPHHDNGCGCEPPHHSHNHNNCGCDNGIRR